MNYKFLNQEQTIVGRIDDDGLMRITGDAIRWEEYLKWLEEGNTPLPPDPEPEPEPLTPQQKLEAAGLSIEELKELLGL
jgi:hypothetical protein